MPFDEKSSTSKAHNPDRPVIITKNTIVPRSGNEPLKLVKHPQDIKRWFNSMAFLNAIEFINKITYMLQGMKLTDQVYVSPQMKSLLNIFNRLHELVEITPNDAPDERRTSFHAFRTWSHRKNHDIFAMIADCLPEDKCYYFNELGYYILESFGLSVGTFSYGTGHELNFIFFMCALFKANILTSEDLPACVLRLFYKYLRFVRRLQRVYKLEPAGSVGYWTLDAHQFLPYIFGSAQLAMDAPFTPQNILDKRTILKYKDENFFLNCIHHTATHRDGHFAEHSQQLWSITAVTDWIVIYESLCRMFQKEVLSKYAILRHLYFGELMSMDPFKIGTPVNFIKLGFKIPEASSSETETATSSGNTSDEITSSEKPSEVDLASMQMSPSFANVEAEPKIEEKVKKGITITTENVPSKQLKASDRVSDDDSSEEDDDNDDDDDDDDEDDDLIARFQSIIQ